MDARQHRLWLSAFAHREYLCEGLSQSLAAHRAIFLTHCLLPRSCFDRRAILTFASTQFAYFSIENHQPPRQGKRDSTTNEAEPFGLQPRSEAVGGAGVGIVGVCSGGKSDVDRKRRPLLLVASS